MNKTFIKIIAIILTFQSFFAIAQEKTTLFYDKDWKGLDNDKKAVYYRIVNYDDGGNTIGVIETFYKSGKLHSKGEAFLIDKLDDTNSLWKNNLVTFNEKGVKLFDQNYDNEGKPHGISYSYDEKGGKKIEAEFIHGDPAKDYYLVYVKGQPIKYSYLTLLPITLATSGKKLVPESERKTIYEDGQPIQYYSFNGISVAVRFTREKQYGNYYAAYITIENGTDKEFNLDPMDFSSVIINGNKVQEAQVLQYDYYIRKVNRKQTWSSAFNSFAERQAATQAGYSSSASSGVATGASTTNSNTSGYIGNAYGNISSTTNSGTVVAGSVATLSHSGATQYAANQNASNNISQYNNNQYNIKNSITQGYLKINTVFPSSRIVGYIYIKYQPAEGLLLNIPINGMVYQFGG